MSGTLKAGRYEVQGVLGAGSQGETLDALDTTSQTRVAIKRFSVRGAASWKDVELAEREARVLSSIDHPGLPRYVDHFEEDGALFLVMHRVEGESLAALRKRGGALSHAEIVRLLADVGDMLDYLHGRAPPLIHRDIKPGNVIRRPDGSFSLVDFGSVRDSLKPEGGSTVVGTFGFMAPEQFQGRALPQSDVYALAATALSLLTGREPETLLHRGLAIDVGAALPQDPAFARVLSKMLEPDPDRRARRVAPLVAELASAPAPPWAAPTGRTKPLVPNVLVVVLLILGLVIARFSTGLLFRVFLPVLLTLLSIFFGGGLRRTASRMRHIGERGDEGIRRAIEIVRGRAFRTRPERAGKRRDQRDARERTRAERGRRVRIEDDDENERAREREEDADRPRRRRHR
jgi:serine/threonine protein kinase